MAPSLEDQIAKLDAEISAVEARLCELRRQRNSLMPIGKLPVEVIIKILSNTVDDAVATCKSKGHADAPFHKWTMVTQIYSKWRDAAVGHAPFWTYVHTTSSTSLRWFETFIERSRDRLLDVDIRFSFGSHDILDRKLRLIVDNLHRVRSLHIQNIKGFFRLQGECAPELEILKVSFPAYKQLDLQVSALPPIVMPKLRQLEASGSWQQSWTHTLPSSFPTVTDLIINGIKPDGQLELLKRCHALRKLQIRWRYRNYLEALEQPFSVVLPDLQELVLHDPAWLVLANITCPSVQRVEFCATLSGRNTCDEIFSIISRTLGPFLSSARSDSTRLHQFSLSWTGFGVILSGKNISGQQIVLLDLKNPEAYTYEVVFLNILRLAQFWGVWIPMVSVKAWASYDESVVSLVKTFRNYVEVTQIHIEDAMTFVRFFSFLLLEMTNPECTSPANGHRGCKKCRAFRLRSFPGLEYIFLSDAKLDEKWLAEKGNSELMELFSDWLEERMRSGIRLASLQLTRSQVKQDMLDRLTQVVDRVDIKD